MRKLEEEIAFYEEQRAKLVDEHGGEFVLIKGRNLCGFFNTEIDAIKAGYEKFGAEPFLVRVCTEVRTPVLFTSLYVGR